MIRCEEARWIDSKRLYESGGVAKGQINNGGRGAVGAGRYSLLVDSIQRIKFQRAGEIG
jgi:hypothetical protein